MSEVLIVGAGAAGVRAAVELDNRNVSTVLLEKNFYIGGALTELSRMYPVCELYFAPQFFYQLNDSHKVKMLTGSYIETIEKNEEGYLITIKKKPRYVTENCTLCLKCVDACEKNAVQKPPFQSVPPIVFIDRKKCGDCQICEDICPENAVNFNEKAEIVTQKVKHVLYCVGAQLFDAEKYTEYGYNRFPDVITSLELERMLHPSYESEFVRPSDGKRPHRIAFLQCIGSRDAVKGEPYCSTICCMQALNEAKVIKERYPDTDITIFFMDMQCPKKGWEQFYNAVSLGVTCIRYRVPLIYEENGVISCVYAGAHLLVKDVDMVVLSVGLTSNAETFGLPLTEYGFPESKANACGCFVHPADITESVQEALASISGIRGEYYQPNPAEPEGGLQIFLCTCGGNTIHTAEVLKKEGYTVFVSDYLCRDEGIKEFLHKVKKEKVVIGACSLHEQLFRRLAREKCNAAVEFVDIKNESTLEPIRMALAKVEHQNIQYTTIDVIPCVCIIGGGIAGLTAALELADDVPVFVVEKSSHLGGRSLTIQYSLDSSPQPLVQTVITRVETHPNITVLTETEIVSCTGCCGNFVLKTSQNSQINCGAVIVAVGADEFAHEYDHPAIITQNQLEERMKNEIPGLIVMIQCWGSRTDQNPWCSAVCCSKAVSTSLALKEQSDAQVVVLYRDMRTYGFADAYYRKAREKGVLFLQSDDMPAIDVDGEKIRVYYTDPVLTTKIMIEPDLVVLSTGITPKKDFSTLAEILGITLDKNGFFRELHPTFYPTDSTREGIFLCGLCHSPQHVKEAIIQAKAAASRVKTIFSSSIQVYDAISVNEAVCTGCCMCVPVCPFNAITLTKENSVSIDVSKCRDCGLCVGCCPVNALTQITLSDEHVLRMVKAV